MSAGWRTKFIKRYINYRTGAVRRMKRALRHAVVPGLSTADTWKRIAAREAQSAAHWTHEIERLKEMS